MTNEERLERMKSVNDYTSNKLEQKLNEIMGLKERMNTLVETLCQAKKNGLCVSKYFSSENGYNTIWVDRYALCFKNNDYPQNTFDDKYYIVACNGHVYTSNYACGYDKEGHMIPSDTFEIGNCSSPNINEETRQKFLRRLTNIVDTFVIFEQKIYADIDNEIETKSK